MAFLVTKKRPNALLFVAMRTLKWPLLSIVFPRLCFIAFNFCQPFLISRTLDWSSQPDDGQTYNIGYGLVGAYFLVYVGIAVSTSTMPCGSISLSISILDLHGPISAFDIPIHYHGPRRADLYALPKSHRSEHYCCGSCRITDSDER